MQAFQKTVFIGITNEGRLNVSIKWDGHRLSITGTEGRNHGGQIVMSPWNIQTYAEGHSAETVQQLRSIWQKWHLNDMQAGSPAQTAFLEANPVNKPDHYTAASQALKAAGLNPDPNYLHEGKPYKYGTAWLTIEVPVEALQYLHQLPQQPAKPTK
jgi:hypothetical protein